MNSLVDSNHNKTFIVISIGRRHIKAGYSKKIEPFVILPVYEIFSECMHVLEINKDEKVKDLNYIRILKDRKFWKSHWNSIIRKLYTDHLKCNPKDFPVLLVEKTFFPIDLSLYICEILLNNLQVPGIKRINESITSLYTTGVITGIVIDIGTYETIVCPIYEGNPIEHNIKIISCGYINLRDVFFHLLSKQYENTSDFELIKNLDEESLDNIIFQSGIVKEDFRKDDDLEKISDFKYENILVKNEYKNIIIEKNTRFEGFEIFFGNKIEDSEMIYDIVLDGIIDCLKNLNIEIRKEISQNILLCGGIASIKGFEKRIYNEINDYIVKDELLKTLKDSFFVSAPPISPFLRSYIGSIIMLLCEKIELGLETREIKKISSRSNSKMSTKSIIK